MTMGMRIVATAVVVCLAAAGPLAPHAMAQQPTQPTQPTAPPQPDLFQEALKTQRPSDGPQAVYELAAIGVNVFLVPGRVITCTLGTALSVGLLVITLGSGYKAASTVVHEGCGGKWWVTGDDLKPEASASRPLESDR